jgi:hypothetical protein
MADDLTSLPTGHSAESGEHPWMVHHERSAHDGAVDLLDVAPNTAPADAARPALRVSIIQRAPPTPTSGAVLDIAISAARLDATISPHHVQLLECFYAVYVAYNSWFMSLSAQVEGSAVPSAQVEGSAVPSAQEGCGEDDGTAPAAYEPASPEAPNTARAAPPMARARPTPPPRRPRTPPLPRRTLQPRSAAAAAATAALRAAATRPTAQRRRPLRTRSRLAPPVGKSTLSPASRAACARPNSRSPLALHAHAHHGAPSFFPTGARPNSRSGKPPNCSSSPHGP